MRIAYLDCASGISGDMTLGALIDAGVDLEAVRAAVDSLRLPSCRLATQVVKKNGFRALQLTVEHEPEHKHRHLHHIDAMIEGSTLTDRQRDLARRVFHKLAEAEARVHGSTIEKVHFHEVGAVDSIADIVGSAVAWDLLGVDRIVASAVPTGCGTIQIAHGKCSVPAPAVAELLRGVPIAASDVPHELTTPTGAAILATLVDAYGPLPAMKIDAIGYGAGQRDLPGQPNLLRLIVGESVDAEPASDQIWVLETNLDDVSGETIGYTTTKLWEAGALDVYTTAIQMKKNRPGVTLTVLCATGDTAKMEKVLFRETGTLGVRRWPASRHKLERRAHTVSTAWGPIEGKLAWIAGQPATFSPEFEACSRVAHAQGVALREVFEAAVKAYQAEAEQAG